MSDQDRLARILLEVVRHAARELREDEELLCKGLAHPGKTLLIAIIRGLTKVF